MISHRNPLRDRVAFVGAASTGFTPRNTDRSRAALAAAACTSVLREVGLTAADVDGICGSVPTAPELQQMLGIPEVSWFANPPTPFINQVVMAASAIHSGLCDTVLAYHSSYRLPWNTPSSLADPFRRPVTPPAAGPGPDTIAGPVAYSSWAARYLYEHAATTDGFALVALNGRSNARDNELAAKREPITLDDYHAARMIRWPLRLLDMDVPVDGGDAFVLTTTERARDLTDHSVLINAAAIGTIDLNTEEQTPGLHRNGQHVVVDALRARSDIWIDGADLLYPYDGFTMIAVSWFENLGFCAPGEAGAYLAANWDAQQTRLLLGGRVPVNTHGGSLSEGATQGSGHVREAVHQLQRRAGRRQCDDARTAIVTGGGYFTNAQGLTLRADG